MTLDNLGWNDFFASAFAPYAEQGFVPARVVAQKGLTQVSTGELETYADLAGKLRHELKGAGGGVHPAVGDWVALRPSTGDGRAVIHAILPRKSKFSRKSPGQRTEEQVVAANVDTIFLVSGLDSDFNPRRIERYLTAAWDSGAQPVVVLNKLDRCDDPETCLLETRSIAMSVPVHRVSALKGTNVEELASYLGPGQTVGLLGSSGVGKSTLTNRLLGREAQRTAEVREGDDRGRHTTTHRELIRLADGVLIIDNPGMREIQLWESEETLDQAFDDVTTLAADCRFRDCAHDREPGCAVRAAIASGRLLAERLESWRKLQGEAEAAVSLQESRLRTLERKRADKVIHKAARSLYKIRDKGK